MQRNKNRIINKQEQTIINMNPPIQQPMYSKNIFIHNDDSGNFTDRVFIHMIS